MGDAEASDCRLDRRAPVGMRHLCIPYLWPEIFSHPELSRFLVVREAGADAPKLGAGIVGDKSGFLYLSGAAVSKNDMVVMSKFAKNDGFFDARGVAPPELLSDLLRLAPLAKWVPGAVAGEVFHRRGLDHQPVDASYFRGVLLLLVSRHEGSRWHASLRRRGQRRDVIFQRFMKGYMESGSKSFCVPA
mgnify:CR=1 FL=1